MKDSQSNLVLGRTRWRRFAAVAGVATAAVVGLMAGIAHGVVPVTIHTDVSGLTARISADKLYAEGFNQYGGKVTTAAANGSKDIPVAASQIKRAEITNLCQSVKVPVGDNFITLFIRAGRDEGKPVVADDLLIAMDYLSGDAVFTNIEIGRDASTLDKGGPSLGAVGDFGQQADIAEIDGLNQRFYSTSASKFRLTGMTLHLKFDGSECFTEVKD